MALSYNLGYQESISVHPTRRQNFAGIVYSNFPNIWEWLVCEYYAKKSFSMIIMLLPFYQSDTALWYCVHAILGFMCEFFSYQDLLKPSEWPSTTFIEEQLFPISVWFSLLGGLPVGLGALRVDLKTSGAEGWFKNPPCVALTLPLHHHVATHLWTEWNPSLWCSPVLYSSFLYSPI